MKIRSLEDFIRTTSQNTQPVFPSLQPEYFSARNIIQHPSTERFEASRQIIVNVGILDSDITLLHEFSKLVELKVEDTDTRLIKLTRTMIDPPTMHITKFSKPAVKTPQATEIDQLLKLKVYTILKILFYNCRTYWRLNIESSCYSYICYENKRDILNL